MNHLLPFKSSNVCGPVLLIGMCLLLAVMSAPAQNQPTAANPTNRPSSDRFLVILDTSASMQKRLTNVLSIVGRMFSSGLNGQLHPGDTIGMWTYNNELQTGQFPLQRWTPRIAHIVTAGIVQFIQQRSYGKQSRLTPVMEQLNKVVADSDRITIILFSDGSEAPAGIPYTAQISEVFGSNADEQRRLAMPFVTILRAAKGEYVGFKVNTPPWPIEFPAFPPEPVPATPQPTNPPPPKVESPKPVPPVATAEPPPTNTASNLAPVAVTNPAVVVVPKATNEVPVSLPEPGATTPPPPTTSIAQVVTNPNALETNVPTTELPTSKSTRSLPALPILVGAGIVLVGIAIFCVTLLRRARETPRVSLITRSMKKDRK